MKKVLTIIALFSLVLTLAACKKDPVVDGPTDAELVAEAKTALLLTNLDSVTANLTLPSSGLHGSVITWASNNTAVIANDGTVTRPAVGEANAVVTLTATITIGDESDTKVWDAVRVIAAVPTLDVTIAEFNSSDVAVGDDCVVTGIVFGIVTGAGVHIYDGTGFLYVYGSTDAVLGDELTITGQKTIYYGLPELQNVTSFVTNSTGNTLATYEPTSVVDLYDEDPFDTLYNSKPITVTGVAVVRGTDVVLVATDADNNPYDIILYYKSDVDKIDELKALAGKMVTADIVVYGFHSTMLSWRVTVNSNAVITSTDLTEEQSASFEASQIDLGLLDAVMEDLALNATAGLATVTWASSNEAVISTAGVVTRQAAATVVTLTASVTVGTATVTREFEVTVAEAGAVYESITVAEAVAAADDEELIVEGVVSGFNGSDNTLLQDADGTAIVIYTSNFAADNNLALGDKIIVRATRGTFYGLNQLSGATLLSLVESDVAVTVFTDVTLADIVADMPGYQGHNVVLTDLVVVSLNYDGKDGYVVVGDGAGNDIMFYNSNVPYATGEWAVGDIVSSLSVIVYDVYYEGNRVIVYEYPELGGASDIFFSEYIEGSSNNKAIEIYNPTPYAILLDGYVISQYKNGSLEATATFDLAGITLAAGDVYVICTDSYTGPAECDEIQTYGEEDAVIFFGGDDAMAVVKNDVVIDVIGVIGEQPTEGFWTVGDAATKDYTIVRASTVVEPNATFTTSEWVGYAQDTFEYLGSHTVIRPDIFFSEYIEGSSNNKAIEIYNPTPYAILLDGYVISQYKNGSLEATATFDLAGITLAAGDVYVICTDSYTGPAECDEIQTYGEEDAVIFFGGDDAMAVVKNDVVIDVIGVIGEQPTEGFWTVGDAATKDYTIVRASTVVEPNATFTTSEWVGYAQDTFEYLGSHTCDLPVVVAP